MTVQEQEKNPQGRKRYVKPRIEEVKLEASEALFQGCKMDTAGMSGKKSGHCTRNWMCFDAGS
jgi:hypothetical protein